MAVNTVATSRNTASSDFTGNGNVLTAGGGFTLPQHAFMPHPSTQAFQVGQGGYVAGAGQRAPNTTVFAYQTGPSAATSLPSQRVYAIAQFAR